MDIKKKVQNTKKMMQDMRGLSARHITRSRKFGTTTVIAVVLVIASIAFLEILSHENYKQFDLTKDKRFTISSQTKNIMNSLDDNLTAVAFYPIDSPLSPHVGDLMDLYKYESNGKFDYRFVDMDMKPGEALKYSIHENETIVLVYGDRNVSVHITENELFDEGEKLLTNAVLKATNVERKVIYFLTQHGERDIKGKDADDFESVSKLLENQNYKVEELDLLTTPTVPEDASLLVIAGSKTDLFPEELESLTEYIDRGGSILITFDAEYRSPSLEKYIGDLGVVATKDIVIDTESRVQGGGPTIPVVSIYLPHPITKGFDISSFFVLSRSLKIDTDVTKSSGWSFNYLAKTGESSWGETDIESVTGGNVSFDEGKDMEGPVPVAVVGTKEIEGSNGADEEENGEIKKVAKMIVFGDSDFVNNSFFINEGNKNFFTNSVNWLCDVEELIAILPKDKKVDSLVLSKERGFWVLIFSFIVPLLLIIIGTMVTLFRRWKI